jgi:hypothetical protein
MSTTPIPTSLASISIMKGLLKLGNARTGAASVLALMSGKPFYALMSTQIESPSSTSCSRVG